MNSPSTFVGRRSELTDLQRGLEEVAASGQGRLFHVVGEPGIGKTRLVDEFAGWARAHGALVLWGRCWESGGAPAYWPWTQILRAYLREGAVAPEAQSLLAALAPINDGRENAVGSDGPDELEHARFRLFDATTNFLQQAASPQPLVLIIDDLHAADAPSLLLLRFLARELRTGRWLLLGTYREFEASQDAQRGPILSDIAREGRVLKLRGLSREDVSDYIHASEGAALAGSIADTVYGTTEGNPLFVHEILHLLAQEPTLVSQVSEGAARLAIPDQLRAIIRRRFEPLSEDARCVLGAASVIGREIELGVLEQTLLHAGHASFPVLRLLDEATRIGLIGRIAGAVGRFVFSHALVRETLYEDLGPILQSKLHRAVARAIESVRRSDLAPHLAEVAFHYFHAAADGDVDAAVSYLRKVGERAQSLFAYEESVKHYEQALQALSLRAGGAASGDSRLACILLLGLGEAQWGAGDLVAMRATFKRAADLARELPGDGGTLLTQAALGLGGRQQRSHAWYDDDLVRLLEESLVRLDEGDSELRARIQARLAYALYLVPGSYDRRVELCTQAVSMARRVAGPQTLRWVLNDWRWALWGPQTSDERIEITGELLTLAEHMQDRELAIVEHTWRLVDMLERADIAAVDAEVEHVRRLAAELHRPWFLWYAGRFSAMQAQLEGRFDDAERLAEQALNVAQRVRHQDAILIYSTLLLTVRMWQGRLAELEAGMQAFIANYPSVPIWQSMMALLHVELGQRDLAQVALDRIAREDFRDLPRDYLMLPAATHLCEVCAALDDRVRAAQLYAILEPYRNRLVVLGFGVASLGAVGRFLGILATTTESWARAAEHFEEALSINQRMRARPAVAQTQFDYARMLLRAPMDAFPEARRGSTHSMLAEARDTARSLGMGALLGKIEDLQASAASEGLGRRWVQTKPTTSNSTKGTEVCFRRIGDYWQLQFDGDVFQLQDLLGLRYIAHLLGNPGREIHVTDLVEMADTRGAKVTRVGTHDHAPSSRGLGDAGEILDARAKQAYKVRLRDLREELAEAEEHNDLGRIEFLREEMTMITQELAGAVGLGGRDRRAASHSERARVSVTKRIGISLKRIAANDPAMARYLNSTLKTGTFCSYTPDPGRPMIWHL